MTEPGTSPAWQLTNYHLEGGWTVLERVELPNDHTGSAFSVGYRVRNDSGDMGYLKAFDYLWALAADDPALELQRIVQEFNAERDILALCGERRLSRVVRVLASGSVRVGDDVYNIVQYLIFELADHDAHTAVVNAEPANQIPMVRLAHGAAAAMAQLHGVGIAHQDAKPSNLLIWNDVTDISSKIADLGCAHFAGRPTPHDDDIIPGDIVHAAPEQIYGCPIRLAERCRRQAADVFMLGNLIVFLLVGVPYNGILMGRLDPTLRPKHWSGPFDEVLPALVDAHGQVLRALRDALPANIEESMIEIIDQLCHPDSSLRGDPVARRTGQNPYRLERFISRLDLIHRRALLESARA